MSFCYLGNQTKIYSRHYLFILGIKIKKFVFNQFAYQIFQESSKFSWRLKNVLYPSKIVLFKSLSFFVRLLIDLRTLSCLKDSHSTSYMSELWGGFTNTYKKSTTTFWLHHTSPLFPTLFRVYVMPRKKIICFYCFLSWLLIHKVAIQYPAGLIQQQYWQSFYDVSNMAH